jgi:hypothetical protein
VLLAATVNLAVAGYSLLPRLPMDGKVLGDERPLLYTVLTLLTELRAPRSCSRRDVGGRRE